MVKEFELGAFRFQHCIGLVICFLIAGCSRPVAQVEEIRPVRVIKLTPMATTLSAEFPGEIRPRIESRLGFRIGGKLVQRNVDVGTVVKRGQVLARLDPQDAQLVLAQAAAARRAATSNRDLARAELQRYQELRAKNFVSQAALDTKQSAYDAALATYDQAAAGYQTQSNQSGYSVLSADTDGVISAVNAEVGQVLAAGAPVLQLARIDQIEAVIAVPESRIQVVNNATSIEVRAWIEPNRIMRGTLRELSPVADPVTRTFTARVALPAAPPGLLLGMSAYATFVAPTLSGVLSVPLTALIRNQQSSAVWVVENGMVKLAPIELGAPVGNQFIVTRGLNPGQVVVTAGANLLKPGQKVSILDAPPAPAAQPAVRPT